VKGFFALRKALPLLENDLHDLLTIKLIVRFQVLTAVNMKFRVFWDVVPCSHVEVDHVSEVRTASIIRVMEAVQ
jgi:hypothetical protein